MENLDINWKIILNWISEKYDEDMYLTDLAQDSDRWRVVVNAVMNLVTSLIR